MLDNEEYGESTTAMAEDEEFWAVEMCRSCKGFALVFHCEAHGCRNEKILFYKKNNSLLLKKLFLRRKTCRMGSVGGNEERGCSA